MLILLGLCGDSSESFRDYGQILLRFGIESVGFFKTLLIRCGDLAKICYSAVWISQVASQILLVFCCGSFAIVLRPSEGKSHFEVTALTGAFLHREPGLEEELLRRAKGLAVSICVRTSVAPMCHHYGNDRTV